MEETDIELLEGFKAEAEEHLADVEPRLLELEGADASRREELLHSIFRAVHSVKGASGFFGLDTIQSLSHAMESVLMRVRDGVIEFDTEMNDPLLDSLDTLSDMIEAIPEVITPPIDSLAARLAKWTEGGETSGGSEDSTSGADANEGLDELPSYSLNMTSDMARAAACFGQKVYRVVLTSDGSLEPESFPALQERLVAVGEIQAEALRDDRAEWLIQSVLSAPELAQAADLATEAVCEAQPEEQAEPAPTSSAAPVETDPAPPAKERGDAEEGGDQAAAALKAAAAKDNETIRVNVRLLDKLMNLAGELVLSRNQLLRSLNDTANTTTKAILQDLDLITSAIQGDIMNTRMQPIGTVFNKFTRIVRDLSKSLDKKVRLSLEGVDVELDKSILELLSDPLTHLIRNSLDHGIESPPERLGKGKSEAGLITLRAYHEGGQIHIEIQDDGAGVDPEKIRSTALKRGLMTREELKNLSDHDARMLIFAPGFSTVEQVSDVSGRGVGMDVVKTNIAKLSGKIDLESQSGQGSVVRIRLPLTLAIIPSIIVRIRDERYAVPQGNLVELVRVRNEDTHQQIELVQGSPVLRLRGRLLPLIDLERVLHESRTEGWSPDWGDTVHVAVIHVGEATFGLVVHDVSDSEEIVVKPLSHMLENCGIYAGVAIMGDGHPAMILDAAGLASAAAIELRDDKVAEEQASRAQSQTSRRQLVLFTNAPQERFAVELSELVRLEKIHRDDIQEVAGNECITYRDGGLQLTRLEEFLPVSPLEDEGDHVFVLIPRCEGTPRGILAGRIIDTVRTDVEITPVEGMPDAVEGQGLIHGQLTLLLRTEELVKSEAV